MVSSLLSCLKLGSPASPAVRLDSRLDRSTSSRCLPLSNAGTDGGSGSALDVRPPANNLSRADNESFISNDEGLEPLFDDWTVSLAGPPISYGTADSSARSRPENTLDDLEDDCAAWVGVVAGGLSLPSGNRDDTSTGGIGGARLVTGPNSPANRPLTGSRGGSAAGKRYEPWPTIPGCGTCLATGETFLAFISGSFAFSRP